MKSCVSSMTADPSLCRGKAPTSTVRASIRVSSMIDRRRHRCGLSTTTTTTKRPLLRRLAASPRDDRDASTTPSSSSSSSLPALNSDAVVSFARSPFFKGPVQAAVALVVLAAVDAAYSGDWSRIGAITKEQEEALKPLVVALGAFHVLCAGVAGFYASQKKNSVPKAVAKAALVGFLAAVEAVLAEEGEGELK